METSVYHRVLRVNAVIVALLVVFDAGFISPVTKQLSDNAISYLASSGTGVYAEVQPNELNTKAAELLEWEQSLKYREASLSEREIATRDFGSGVDYSTYILSAILFLLTVLIITNYVLDFRRIRNQMYEKQVV